jgi:hypothetical protein
MTMKTICEGGTWTRDSWGLVPPPFNKDYDPLAEARYKAVTASLERDNYYSTHTREECKAEWARRYDTLKASGL